MRLDWLHEYIDIGKDAEAVISSDKYRSCTIFKPQLQRAADYATLSKCKYNSMAFGIKIRSAPVH